ncbi:hypothetical protein HMPREF9370_2132 [Neisseria wadsworthii 9715]|uniref:Uncharacterized protein n=1 Tax=Neisseria wadsworthii 9715 TaxID=1030841 RepID=G4CSQ0_9NEIS|nr:hypothetical protein HMPREF9370_2132 [Neisseria wadsworthii 9715]
MSQSGKAARIIYACLKTRVAGLANTAAYTLYAPYLNLSLCIHKNLVYP